MPRTLEDLERDLLNRFLKFLGTTNHRIIQTPETGGELIDPKDYPRLLREFEQAQRARPRTGPLHVPRNR